MAAGAAAVPVIAALEGLRQLLSFETGAARAHLGVTNLGRRLAPVGTVLDELKAGGADGATSAMADDLVRHFAQIEASPAA